MLWFALVSGSAELVPYFAQRPLSYLVYPGIRDAYTNIDFEISFKPERGDGWYQLFCYHFVLCYYSLSISNFLVTYDLILLENTTTSY